MNPQLSYKSPLPTRYRALGTWEFGSVGIPATKQINIAYGGDNFIFFYKDETHRL
jgi:hypothetical protein